MAGYADEVNADSPFRYWRMSGASSSPLPEENANTGITLAGGATAVSAGGGPLHSSQDTGAWSFDGVDDRGSVAVNLSGTAVVTVEFWLKWDSYAANDDLVFEYTANYNGGGGFIFDPNDSGGNFGIGMADGATYNYRRITRPSAAAWHHYAIVLDKPQAAASEITVYVDGSSVSLTTVISGNLSANFANDTLYFMSRAGSSLFGAGDLCHAALYTSALSSTRVLAHYNAASTDVGSGGTTNHFLGTLGVGA